ncbi:MAG: organomercurial lyase [Gemmatimonadota bacterium]|nr:hypothetical protein [Gemmatimonadota bacterium]
MDDLARLTRWMVYQHFAQTGTAPPFDRLVRLVDRPADEVRAALGRLDQAHQVVLASDGESIHMAHPFAGYASGVTVDAGGTRYAANCIWDGLALPALLGRDAVVEAEAVRGAPFRFQIRDGVLASTVSWIHLQVPAARFWDDIGYT